MINNQSVNLQKGRSIPLVQQLLTKPVHLSNFVDFAVFCQKPQIFFLPRCPFTIQEMNIDALQLCRNVKCCCFTTESSCSTSILTSGYIDDLIKKIDPKMLLPGICMQVTLYTKKAKDDTFIKTTIPHTEFKHFPKTSTKALKKFLPKRTSKITLCRRTLYWC